MHNYNLNLHSFAEKAFQIKLFSFGHSRCFASSADLHWRKIVSVRTYPLFILTNW